MVKFEYTPSPSIIYFDENEFEYLVDSKIKEGIEEGDYSICYYDEDDMYSLVEEILEYNNLFGYDNKNFTLDLYGVSLFCNYADELMDKAFEYCVGVIEQECEKYRP